jgi:3-hydroxybutyryl-CoA dehydrogenase
MKNIFVVGAGTMGLDIAQVFAAAGFSVTVRDITSDIIEKAQNRLTTTLNKRVEARQDDKRGYGRDSKQYSLHNRIAGSE